MGWGGGGSTYTRESLCSSCAGVPALNFCLRKNCLGLISIITPRTRTNPTSSSSHLPSLPPLTTPSLLPYPPSTYLPSYPIPSPPAPSTAEIFNPNCQIPYVTFFLGRPLCARR